MRLLVLGAAVMLAVAGLSACDHQVKPPFDAASGPKDCGRVDQRFGSKPISASSSGPVACMRRALDAHRAAEITITSYTVEGDPIHEIYRLGPTGWVMYTIDNREDGFAGSDKGIRELGCRRPKWLPGAICPSDPSLPPAPATWVLDRRGAPITQFTSEFVALVTRVACSSGRTGKVLAPKVELGAHRVVVTFQVEGLPRRAYFCNGNNAVRYRVRLSQPLKGRVVVDGQCQNSRVARTAMCGTDLRIHALSAQK